MGALRAVELCGGLARRLAAQGTPFEELILPNEIHEFLRYDSWVKADTATVRFLEDKLKP